uniref:Uncharacterized protein n=1 Tax=Anguilla anguilla TaxID=7936 RepID=A0A0E9V7G3_ANGAN
MHIIHNPVIRINSFSAAHRHEQSIHDQSTMPSSQNSESISK